MIFVPWFNLPYLVPWHKAGTRYPEASMKKAWHMAICITSLSLLSCYFNKGSQATNHHSRSIPGKILQYVSTMGYGSCGRLSLNTSLLLALFGKGRPLMVRSTLSRPPFW